MVVKEGCRIGGVLFGGVPGVEPATVLVIGAGTVGTQAQNQTRENMKAIAPQAQASDYYNRLLKRMSDQDGQLDAQQIQRGDL